MEKLRFAVAYGADAVYLAGKAYGMRTASGNFTPDEMAEAVQYCHARGVKVYVTVNTLPRDAEMAHLPAYNGHGAATVELSVDTAYIENWSILEFTLYGETQATLEEYLNLLVSEGYEEKQGEDGTYYLRLRGEEADQFAYEFSEDAVVTVTWVTCPAADLMAE